MYAHIYIYIHICVHTKQLKTFKRDYSSVMSAEHKFQQLKLKDWNMQEMWTLFSSNSLQYIKMNTFKGLNHKDSVMTVQILPVWDITITITITVTCHLSRVSCQPADHSSAAPTLAGQQAPAGPLPVRGGSGQRGGLRGSFPGHVRLVPSRFPRIRLSSRAHAAHSSAARREGEWGGGDQRCRLLIGWHALLLLSSSSCPKHVTLSHGRTRGDIFIPTPDHIYVKYGLYVKCEVYISEVYACKICIVDTTYICEDYTHTHI